MGIINARVTFRNSPIHVLERFALRDVGGACARFVRSGLDECVIIQTCNRVELFARAGPGGRGRITSTWASLAGIDEGDFEGNVEFDEGSGAYGHLLRLVSGLDSMVLGEEQILGQVRGSIASAREAGSSGRHLDALFDKAIRTGTRIRNSSGIGRGGVSVGSMAVRLAEENVDDLKSKRVLLIGTGEVSTLVAKSLQRRGYAFDVTSRTLERARAFCEALGGSPARFEDVLAGFGRYDALFVATAAPYFLVTRERIAAAMRGRGGMMILDLSNPRTVDERVATIGGVKLMNLDQIAEMVDRNVRARRGKAEAVENIIGEEVGALEASMRRLDAEPLVRDVFQGAEEIRARELGRALRELSEEDAGRIRVLEEMTRSIVEGIVSTPMNNVRRASERGRPDVVELAGKIFRDGGLD